MRQRQNFVLAALLRVLRFLTEYASQLSAAVDLTVARQRLDEVITSFRAHALDEDANRRSAKGETEKQRQLRLKLREQQMQPIAEIARRHLRTVPEFKALQMPARSAKGEVFLASATAMASAAALYKDALLERGLPADSFDLFQAALLKLAESVGARDDHYTNRKGATKGLTFQEQEGRSVLKLLNGLVRRAIGNDPVLIAKWDGARTIFGRAPGTPAPEPAPDGTTISPSPAAATA